MLLLGRCVLLSALAWGQQHPPRSGPKARRSRGRRDGARRLEDTTVPTKVPTSVPTALPTAMPTPTAFSRKPTGSPTSAPSSEPTQTFRPTGVPTSTPTAVPTPMPACCVEHQFSATGEVESTTCSGSRSPWDAATMTELCTAGYSEAGDVAPPFRDCRQEAIDSGNCEQNCAECDHNVGRYFANVGYASCPDWVVDAMNAEAENGGQCAEGLGGVWTCPTCDGWCSCEDCPGPDPNACDWNCDEPRSEPTWGGTKGDCGDDDDDDDSVGKIIGPIVAGVVIVTAAFGPWVYCHMRKKAAEAPPPTVEAPVLGTVVSVDGLGVGGRRRLRRLGVGGDRRVGPAPGFSGPVGAVGGGDAGGGAASQLGDAAAGAASQLLQRLRRPGPGPVLRAVRRPRVATL